MFDGVRRLVSNQKRCRESALPLAALVVAGLGFSSLHEADGDLALRNAIGVAHAGRSTSYDYDHDGLTNLTEKVLGSSPYVVDTDGDGHPDIEEFARNSDPSDATSLPLPSSLSLAMSASGEHDGLHLQVAAYFTDNDFTNKNFEFGLVVNGELRPLSQVLGQPGVQVTRGLTMGGSGGLLLLNIPFPESVVHTVGQISIFVTLNVDGSPFVDAAAGVDLFSHENVVMILQDGPTERWESYQSQQQSGSSGGGPNAGSVYTPIPSGGGGVPNTWTPGEICFQASIEIGSENGVVSHEVVAADCISGWDAQCRSDCGASVGETFDTFDPLGLVGG